MGSTLGAQTGAATRLGLTIEEYHRRLKAGLRHCSMCEQWRDADRFSRSSRNLHGRQSQCRDCLRPYMRDFMRGRVRIIQGAPS